MSRNGSLYERYFSTGLPAVLSEVFSSVLFCLPVSTLGTYENVNTTTVQAQEYREGNLRLVGGWLIPKWRVEGRVCCVKLYNCSFV
jgi:hypothetical protein